MEKSETINVFVSFREETCAGCGEALYPGNWILLEDPGPLCLSCADLDHLVFLPSGDAALTRRARKHSTLTAVVLKWSRARRRNERQGLLVDRKALEQAEEECLADADVRARRRERDAMRREQLDHEFVRSFAARIRELFPSCPPGVEGEIAEHACLRSSGRVGRTGAAKSLEEEPVRLAVIAHIRHTATEYDELLARYYDRKLARTQVQGEIEKTLAEWSA